MLVKSFLIVNEICGQFVVIFFLHKKRYISKTLLDHIRSQYIRYTTPFQIRLEYVSYVSTNLVM
jgi:hypothetical protein